MVDGLVRGRGPITNNPTMNLEHDTHADITTVERARGVGYMDQIRGRTVKAILTARAEVMLETGAAIEDVRHFLGVATAYAKGLGILKVKP